MGLLFALLVELPAQLVELPAQLAQLPVKLGYLPAMIAFAAAFCCALVLTPLFGRLATRCGAVDRPDGSRKQQRQPIPLGGGLAVALAACLAGLLAVATDATTLTGAGPVLWGLLPAAIVLIVVGVIDDFCSLTGIYKFAGQVLAVSLLVANGFQFEMVSFLGYEIPFGDLAIPFSIFFCLGAINAFNLLDGADGLAGSVGTVVCLTLGIIAWSLRDYVDSVACFAFAGALVGFLRYNLPPARIYLGDTGSMLIGLVVAAVAIDCSIKEQAAFALVVPIAVCAIPILDAAAALVRRVTTGQSVFTPDRGHLHHALLLRGWSVGRTVAFISGLTALTCGGAMLSFFTGHELYAIVTTTGVVAALAGSRVFGHGEARLLASHTRLVARRVLRGPIRRSSRDVENTVQLQGNREWQNIWQALREAAPVYNVAGLRLNVNIPRLHESFYGSWKKSGSDVIEDPWRIQMPLMSGAQQVGKLSIIGNSTGKQSVHDMQHSLAAVRHSHRV
jgi:UDP-GlcNAc:undecaprenyl-phosphate/decaprenyl-phosphate GlcNAc-1-phosphate transferase